jgi:hypothetical protein
LAAHDETIKAAKTRARELDLAERRVAARVAELSEEIIEAHARGDAIAASKLAKERSRLNSTQLALPRRWSPARSGP